MKLVIIVAGGILISMAIAGCSGGGGGGDAPPPPTATLAPPTAHPGADGAAGADAQSRRRYRFPNQRRSQRLHPPRRRFQPQRRRRSRRRRLPSPRRRPVPTPTRSPRRLRRRCRPSPSSACSRAPWSFCSWGATSGSRSGMPTAFLSGTGSGRRRLDGRGPVRGWSPTRRSRSELRIDPGGRPGANPRRSHSVNKRIHTRRRARRPDLPTVGL